MRHFFMSVAGETFRNADGSDRQAIIQRCRVGDPMRLEHEPTNSHDENAIRVLRWNREQVGYLPAEVAAEIVDDSRRGATYHAIVALVGRQHRRRPYGIALLVVSDNAPMDASAAQTYAIRALSAERGLRGPKSSAVRQRRTCATTRPRSPSSCSSSL